MELFDSQAHYNDEKFEEDRTKILKDIYNFGVTKLINAGYSLEASKKAIDIAKKYDFVYATVGISPNDVEDFKEGYLKEIEELAINKKVVAIGEIGWLKGYLTRFLPLPKKKANKGQLKGQRIISLETGQE